MLALTYPYGSTSPSVTFSKECPTFFCINSQTIDNGCPVAHTKVITQLDMLEHWLATGIPTSKILTELQPLLPIERGGSVSLASHSHFQFKVNKQYRNSRVLDIDFLPGKFSSGNLDDNFGAWQQMLIAAKEEGLGKVSHPNLFAAMIQN